MKSKNFASICTGMGKNSGQGFDALADPNRHGDGVITVSETAQALVAQVQAFATGGTLQVQTYALFAEQDQPMLNAYEQLRQSVYGALVMQTRLKPYLDAVGLVILPLINAILSNDPEWRTCA